MSGVFSGKLAERTSYTGNWILLYSNDVAVSTAQDTDTYHGLHDLNESVCVVIFNQNDEILMVRSDDDNTDTGKWRIPSGPIEECETSNEAAERECLDGAGCEIHGLTYLCCHNPGDGVTDRPMHVYAARISNDFESFEANDEESRSWVKREKMIDMLKNDDMRGEATMRALLHVLEFYF